MATLVAGCAARIVEKTENVSSLSSEQMLEYNDFVGRVVLLLRYDENTEKWAVRMYIGGEVRKCLIRARCLKIVDTPASAFAIDLSALFQQFRAQTKRMKDFKTRLTEIEKINKQLEEAPQNEIETLQQNLIQEMSFISDGVPAVQTQLTILSSRLEKLSGGVGSSAEAVRAKKTNNDKRNNSKSLAALTQFEQVSINGDLSAEALEARGMGQMAIRLLRGTASEDDAVKYEFLLLHQVSFDTVGAMAERLGKFYRFKKRLQDAVRVYRVGIDRGRKDFFCAMSLSEMYLKCEEIRTLSGYEEALVAATEQPLDQINMGNEDVEGKQQLMAVYRRANYEAGEMFLRVNVPEVQFPYSEEEKKQTDPERARSFLWRAARLGHDKAGERLFNLAASDSEKLNVLVELKTCNVSASIILALAYYDGKEFGIKKNVPRALKMLQPLTFVNGKEMGSAKAIHLFMRFLDDDGERNMVSRKAKVAFLRKIVQIPLPSIKEDAVMMPVPGGRWDKTLLGIEQVGARLRANFVKGKLSDWDTWNVSTIRASRYTITGNGTSAYAKTPLIYVTVQSWAYFRLSLCNKTLTPTERFRHQKVAAEMGHPSAQCNYGIALCGANSCDYSAATIDREMGVQMLERAGANGIGDAYAELGRLYLQGENGFSKDVVKARSYFDKFKDVHGYEAPYYKETLEAKHQLARYLEDKSIAEKLAAVSSDNFMSNAAQSISCELLQPDHGDGPSICLTLEERIKAADSASKEHLHIYTHSLSLLMCVESLPTQQMHDISSGGYAQRVLTKHNDDLRAHAQRPTEMIDTKKLTAHACLFEAILYWESGLRVVLAKPPAKDLDVLHAVRRMHTAISIDQRACCCNEPVMPQLEMFLKRAAGLAGVGPCSGSYVFNDDTNSFHCQSSPRTRTGQFTVDADPFISDAGWSCCVLAVYLRALSFDNPYSFRSASVLVKLAENQVSNYDGYTSAKLYSRRLRQHGEALLFRAGIQHRMSRRISGYRSPENIMWLQQLYENALLYRQPPSEPQQQQSSHAKLVQGALDDAKLGGEQCFKSARVATVAQCLDPKEISRVSTEQLKLLSQLCIQMGLLRTGTRVKLPSCNEIGVVANYHKTKYQCLKMDHKTKYKLQGLVSASHLNGAIVRRDLKTKGRFTVYFDSLPHQKPVRVKPENLIKISTNSSSKEEYVYVDSKDLEEALVPTMSELRARARKVLCSNKDTAFSLMRDDLSPSSCYRICPASLILWRCHYIAVRCRLDQFLCIRSGMGLQWRTNIACCVFGVPGLDPEKLRIVFKTLPLGYTAPIPLGEPILVELLLWSTDFAMRVGASQMSEYRKTMEVVDGIERVCNRAIWGRLSHLASCFSFYCEHFRTDRYHKKLDGSKLARLVAGMGPGRGTAWWQDNIANAVGIKKQKFQKMQTEGRMTNAVEEHQNMQPCSNCQDLFPVRSLKRCQRCRLVRYCSVACQRKAWGIHKKSCTKQKSKS